MSVSVAYYNEYDKFAAAWLRELIKAGHIAPGEVDERSIEDVTPNDLAGFTQCHFFAGIGGWSYALRRAGWSDDRQVWTGSCPCQPFSAAGKGGGFADERHLWPAFHHLIAQRKPTVVFGEQVASKAVDAWVDLVHADLEAVGYAFGSVPFPSAGVGAPHIRDRNLWVADSDCSGLQGHRGFGEKQIQEGRQGADGYRSESGGLSNTSATNGFWRDADWLRCRDGKWRPVEPGTFPLAHGVSSRVGRLRGYGNAINARAAQSFIESYLTI
jgi:DNA (cytosine-5)-methyltransferase 1